jgi:hypothetical protein
MQMKGAILVASIAALLTASLVAQTTQAKALPLENQGLEHLDIVVPDPAASVRFYARLFRSALHQQPVRDTLRYFVLGTRVLPAADEPDVVRVADNNGIIVEVRLAE